MKLAILLLSTATVCAQPVVVSIAPPASHIVQVGYEESPQFVRAYYPVLTVTGLKPGQWVFPQISGDMKQWINLPVVVATNCTMTIQINYPGAPDRCFYRVRVTK